MRSRRLACLLLGMWLAGSVISCWNYLAARRTGDELLAARNAGASLRLKALAAQDGRLLLQYAAWEQARTALDEWGWTELGLGAVFFFFLLFGTGEGAAPLVAALFMLSIAASQAFLLNPALISLGRLTDFLGPGVDPGDRSKLGVLQLCLIGMVALKSLIGIVVAWLLVRHRRGEGSGGAWDQLNVANRADHSNVNR